MLSDDPVKEKAIRTLISCNYREQFDAALEYIKLAKLENDPNIIEWVSFVRYIGFFDDVSF